MDQIAVTGSTFWNPILDLNLLVVYCDSIIIIRIVNKNKLYALSRLLKVNCIRQGFCILMVNFLLRSTFRCSFRFPRKVFLKRKLKLLMLKVTVNTCPESAMGAPPRLWMERGLSFFLIQIDFCWFFYNSSYCFIPVSLLSGLKIQFAVNVRVINYLNLSLNLNSEGQIILCSHSLKFPKCLSQGKNTAKI